jgi:hypothetical protein
LVLVCSGVDGRLPDLIPGTKIVHDSGNEDHHELVKGVSWSGTVQRPVFHPLCLCPAGELMVKTVRLIIQREKNSIDAKFQGTAHDIFYDKSCGDHRRRDSA